MLVFAIATSMSRTIERLIACKYSQEKFNDKNRSISKDTKRSVDIEPLTYVKIHNLL